MVQLGHSSWCAQVIPPSASICGIFGVWSKESLHLLGSPRKETRRADSLELIPVGSYIGRKVHERRRRLRLAKPGKRHALGLRYRRRLYNCRRSGESSACHCRKVGRNWNSRPPGKSSVCLPIDVDPLQVCPETPYEIGLLGHLERHRSVSPSTSILCRCVPILESIHTYYPMESNELTKSNGFVLCRHFSPSISLPRSTLAFPGSLE